MAQPDSHFSSVAYLSAVIAYIVLLTLGLVGNAAVLGTVLVDVRRLPDRRHHITVNMNQIAVGLQCIANVLVGTFAVWLFAYVVIDGAESLQHFQSACLAVPVMFVWTGLLYLMGLLAMSVDRVMAVRRHPTGLPSGYEHRSVPMTMLSLWLTVVGFFLYSTTVTVVLMMSKGLAVSMSFLCITHVDDRLEMHGIPVSQLTAVL